MLFCDLCIAYISCFADLDMGEDIGKFHIGAGDGDGGSIDGNICHLNDQNIAVIVVGIDHSVSHNQRCKGLVGIFDDVCKSLVIGGGYHIDTFDPVYQLSIIRADQKVGFLAFVQIQHLLRIIAVHGGVEKLLHLRGVKRAVQRNTQGRIIVLVQQENLCIEILRNFIGEFQGGAGLVRCDNGVRAGQKLHTVFVIDAYQQIGILHGVEGHHGCGILHQQLIDRIARFVIAFRA